MFFVYILYSEDFDKYYIGHTNNLQNRIWSHNNPKGNTFTSRYRPWKYAVCFEAGEDRAKAMYIEKK